MAGNRPGPPSNSFNVYPGRLFPASLLQVVRPRLQVDAASYSAPHPATPSPLLSVRTRVQIQTESSLADTESASSRSPYPPSMASAAAQPAEDVRSSQPTPKPPDVPNGRPPGAARMFPLGYKEGFSQWVCFQLLTHDRQTGVFSSGKLTRNVFFNSNSGRVFHQLPQNTESSPLSRTCGSHPPTYRQARWARPPASRLIV